MQQMCLPSAAVAAAAANAIVLAPFTCAALMMRYVATSVAVPPSSKPSLSCSSICSSTHSNAANASYICVRSMAAS